ncbi:MAG: hypothetical protein WBA77_05425 [Microcoleaceae cyanobacterium]
MKRLMFFVTALMMISVTGLTACQSETNVQETPAEEQTSEETPAENTVPVTNDIPSKPTEEKNQSSTGNQLLLVDYSTNKIIPEAGILDQSTEATVLSQYEDESLVEEDKIDYSTDEVEPGAEYFDEEMEFSEEEFSEESEYMMEEDNYESEKMMSEPESEYTEQ